MYVISGIYPSFSLEDGCVKNEHRAEKTIKLLASFKIMAPQESTPRVVEEPSTHKKMQAYLGMAVGVVFFILLGMVVLNVWNKSSGTQSTEG